MSKQEFKMAAPIFADDILGPFGTSEKVVYFEKFSAITNNIQVADKAWNDGTFNYFPEIHSSKGVRK